MKAQRLGLFVVILFLTKSCCPPRDYSKISLDPYEKAVETLIRERDILVKYEGEFNASGRDNYIFFGGKPEFAKLVDRANSKNLESLISLWRDGLLVNGPASLWFMKNNNVYFEINECMNSREFLVYDGGQEIEIDAQSDIRKYRIKPGWIYMKMMK